MCHRWRFGRVCWSLALKVVRLPKGELGSRPCKPRLHAGTDRHPAWRYSGAMKKLLVALSLIVAAGLANAEEGVVDKTKAAVEHGAEVTVHAVKRGVHAAGRGIKHGAEATGHGLVVAGEATKRGLHRAGEATGRAAHKVGEKLSPGNGSNR